MVPAAQAASLPRMANYAPRSAVTVGFTAFTTLLFELIQTRVLSYIFWDHVVYLTVSLALLGFGVSGTLVALLAPRKDLLAPRLIAALPKAS